MSVTLTISIYSVGLIYSKIYIKKKYSDVYADIPSIKTTLRTNGGVNVVPESRTLMEFYITQYHL